MTVSLQAQMNLFNAKRENTQTWHRFVSTRHRNLLLEHFVKGGRLYELNTLGTYVSVRTWYVWMFKILYQIHI